MVNTLELVDIVWARLNASVLKTGPDAITGQIYKNNRPLGSKTEDIVINSLPVNNLQLQTAIVNVNIHVPNLVLSINGTQDTTQPDHARLKTLTTLALAVLADQWTADYNYDVQQEVLIEEEEFHEHYINIRIEFFYINISN